MRLSQNAYLNQVLERFNMTEALPMDTPMTKEFAEKAGLYRVISQAEIDFLMYIPYRELIGSLLYLAGQTRQDISFAVLILYRFTNDPTHRD